LLQKRFLHDITVYDKPAFKLANPMQIAC